MPKRFLLIGLIMALVSALYSQRDIAFSTDEYLGGGIGYTPTFLLFDIAEAFPFDYGADPTGLLDTVGLDFEDEEISSLGNMLVIHGAEGFGNVSGKWRIGAYVGFGSKSITQVDTATELRSDLKIALMTGSASIEYVIPLFSNLEIAAGSLFGLSRAVIQFAKIDGQQLWEDKFIYHDFGPDNYSVTLSGTFFTFQPYIAIKLQFLDRAGLRVSGGYHVGTLPAAKWKLNDFVDIVAPDDSNFNAPAVRVMLYLGI